jgi:dipeptidyl aminopeptidase/acylaminoacyl peptidase
MSGLTPESIYEYTRVSEVVLSPDGKRAAFVANEFDPGEDRTRTSVSTVPTDGSRDPHLRR